MRGIMRGAPYALHHYARAARGCAGPRPSPKWVQLGPIGPKCCTTLCVGPRPDPGPGPNGPNRAGGDGDGGSISQSPPAPIPSRPGTDGNPFGQDFPKPTAGKNVRRAYARAYGAHNSAHNFAARRASGEGSGGVCGGGSGGYLGRLLEGSYMLQNSCKNQHIVDFRQSPDGPGVSLNVTKSL